MSGTIHNSRLDSGDQELVDSCSKEWEFSTGEFCQGLQIHDLSDLCGKNLKKSDLFE